MGFIKDNRRYKVLKDANKEIKKNKDDLDYIKNKMDNLYQFMKDIARDYANKDRTVKFDYYDFVMLLSDVENQIPLQFILNNNPDYIPNKFVKIEKERIDDYTNEEIIKYIVNRARAFLSTSLSETPNPVDLAKTDLLNHCAEATRDVIFICDALGLNSSEEHIPPCFCFDYNIYTMGNNHVYATVHVRDKSYIVDITYSQFFKLGKNNLNSIGIPFLGGCSLGVYMTMNEKRHVFAEKLMRDGYFEVTDENIKLYFDGFAMSYRNGLYYEDRGILDYSTDYTAQDYINFISGKDDQLSHEKMEHLGPQKKVLKDPSISFIPRK